MVLIDTMLDDLKIKLEIQRKKAKLIKTDSQEYKKANGIIKIIFWFQSVLYFHKQSGCVTAQELISSLEKEMDKLNESIDVCNINEWHKDVEQDNNNNASTLNKKKRMYEVIMNYVKKFVDMHSDNTRQ